MIGNDIIDLKLAAEESNWQRSGYLEKIFTAEEQVLIHSSADPFRMVWLLWSCKEAVYKIVHRRTKIRKYAPLSFHCSADMVVHEGFSYYVRSEQSSEHIYTIAVENPVLFDLLQTVNEVTKDENGIPYYEGRPASVSHHGRFKAMIAILPSLF